MLRFDCNSQNCPPKTHFDLIVLRCHFSAGDFWSTVLKRRFTFAARKGSLLTQSEFVFSLFEWDEGGWGSYHTAPRQMIKKLVDKNAVKPKIGLGGYLKGYLKCPFQFSCLLPRSYILNYFVAFHLIERYKITVLLCIFKFQ